MDPACLRANYVYSVKIDQINICPQNFVRLALKSAQNLNEVLKIRTMGGGEVQFGKSPRDIILSLLSFHEKWELGALL